MGKSPKASTKKVMQLNAQRDSSLLVSVHPKTNLPSGTQAEIKAIPRKCSIQNPYSLANHLVKTPSPVLQKTPWSCQPSPARIYNSELTQLSSLEISLPPLQDIGLSGKFPRTTAIHKKRPYNSILPMDDGSSEDCLDDSITLSDKHSCEPRTPSILRVYKRPRTDMTCSAPNKHVSPPKASVNLRVIRNKCRLPALTPIDKSSLIFEPREQQCRGWGSLVKLPDFLLRQIYWAFHSLKGIYGFMNPVTSQDLIFQNIQSLVKFQALAKGYLERRQMALANITRKSLARLIQKAWSGFKLQMALKHKAATTLQSFFKMIKHRKFFLINRLWQAINWQGMQFKSLTEMRYVNLDDIENMNILDLITVKNTFCNAFRLYPINLVNAGVRSKQNIRALNAEPFLEPTSEFSGMVRFNFEDSEPGPNTSAEELASTCNRRSILKKTIRVPYHFDPRGLEPVRVLKFKKDPFRRRSRRKARYTE